jgi:hypothetical protein
MGSSADGNPGGAICRALSVLRPSEHGTGESWLSPPQHVNDRHPRGDGRARLVCAGGRLRPRAEVTRLRNCRGEVEELFRKFETAAEPSARLVLMERLEEVSYRELRDFLTLHDEASFVL